MGVFLKRFRELKERDIVIMKFEQNTFESNMLQTIKDFDQNKAARGEYLCLVQTNEFFTTDAYLALIAKAQQKMLKQTQQQHRKADLQLTLDHFLHSRPREVIEAQTKVVATALRVESKLK